MDGPLRVLAVDDDDIERMNIERGFRRAGIDAELRFARDGREAIDLLLSVDDASPWSPPYVVLLDLNMPRMNGLEFLRALRAEPALRRTVVFVLTTSDNEEDRRVAYDQNVAGYFVKEQAGQDLREFFEMLHGYWRFVSLAA